MTHISKLITFSLVSLSSLSLASCFGAGGEVGSALSALKQQELEQAVFFLESNLQGLGDVGYTQWIPSTAADELVTTMNAAGILLPEEEADYREAGIKPKEPIPYVLNQPTEAWQIVLIPDDVQQVIHIKAYGKDLETPVIEKDLPCCSY